MKMLLIAATALAFSQVPPSETRPSAAQLERARAALDAQLFDYTTARFRDVKANDFGICGNVNSKNRLGAYAGWSKFVVFYQDPEEPASVYVEGGEGSSEIMIGVLCDRPQNFGPTDYAERLQYRP